MMPPKIEGQGREECLARRWLSLCRRLGAESDPLAACSQILAAYAQPSRHYHNLDHLCQCLAELDETSDNFGDVLAAEAAIWFHDFVYEPGAADNESRSARKAGEVFRGLGLGKARIGKIDRMIRATDHRLPPGSNDARLVCDIDLSVLGQPPDRYEAYADAIRCEAGLSDAEFRRRRADFLRSMLARPSIYSTELFRSRLETQSRANMARELASLEAVR